MSIENNLTPKIRKSTRTSGSKSSSLNLENRVSIVGLNDGLGKRYYDRLGLEMDKILQVDIVNNVTETRGSVRMRSIKLALAMSQKEIVQKDIVVICCSVGQADQTIVVLATLFLGAIVAPLDPLFDFKDSCYLVKKLKPKLIFTDTRMMSQIERILFTLNMTIPVINFGRGGTPSNYFKLGVSDEENSFNPVSLEDFKRTVAFILPTQGTTGTPKLVCMSHHNIYIQTLIFIEIFDNPDKVLSFFPLSMLLQTILVCVTFETTTTLFLPGTFTERNACKFIFDFQISHAAFGTEFAIKVVHSFALKDYNINSLKSVMIGISNTTKQDILRMQKSMPNVKFLQYYLLTETGCIAATKINNYKESLEKPGSAGTLMINSKIKLVDINTNQTVGPFKQGEVYYNGDGLMLGYYKDNTATLASIEKGYFKTGDLGMYDSDGWFFFQERIEDIIIREDELLCPSLAIEDLIISHPNINDAVVIGNAREIIAFVKKLEGKEISETGLSKFISSRCPNEKHWPTKIIFLESFPKTSLGHIKRRVLRKTFLEVQIQHADSLASIV